MSQTCAIFAVVLLLAVQLCAGEKSCSLWSSAGPVVPLRSTFIVYCSFNCNCKGSMSSGHPPAAQSHSTLNSTTIYFRVVNITKNRTYSCHCNCSPALDPCGMDISAGHLPDRPKNVSCTFKVKDNESGDVFCTWNTGRDTLLGNSSTLWIRTVSGNGTDELRLTRKGTDSPSGSFPLSTSVQLISVRVHVQNPLGSAESSTINYTLRDIVMPSSPDLVQVDCLSRRCSVAVKQPVRTEHLEIQYTAGQTWTTYTQQVAPMSSVWSISSLEPYRLYHFKARSKFATGLWSEWSSTVTSWTEEETPAEELDVWFSEHASDHSSLRVYWKEPHISVSRGKITGYQLKACAPDCGRYFIANVSADVRNYSVPFCPNCKVTVWARNSKGLSPPASVTARYTEAQPPQNVRVTRGERGVAIYWTKPVTAPLPVAYLVEWYPAGHKMEELRWVRLSGNDRHVVITDMKAFECYQGAVFVFYSDNSASSTTFTGVATQESAPTAGPQVEYIYTGKENRVTWTELPRGQRMGCITKYTIYLEGSGEHKKTYSVPASERGYVIQGLSPDSYSVWVTASTAAAEGPAGQKDRFFVQKSQISLLLVCGVVSAVLLFVVCLCQCSAVKQRFWMFFQCLILDVVPDPANSKWAKECTQEKGKMNLQMQSNSSSREEEEPILVNVEELPKHMSGSVSSQYPAQTCQSPDVEPATLLYPVTTYITSLSHNSDSSDHTHTSMDTNTTVGYISNQEPGNIHEEEEDEDEEFPEELRFFPSPVFLEQLNFGGKLTLDSVKIS
ncbi:interleukin-12 receptor subunit beta-2 [Betta splendens]|uniref:Interleukin-12 receptor subunit beta-2 n=1 Tax=Betta splendens TaxID=158456 RepID=A0A6P7M7M8_BETSP|nr:interleukin-12 receptor subunit beta-2 [Betta splendens]